MILPVESPRSLKAPELASRHRRSSSTIRMGSDWCERTARSSSSSSFRPSLTSQLLVSCSEAAECIQHLLRPVDQGGAVIGGQPHTSTDSKNCGEYLTKSGQATFSGQYLFHWGHGRTEQWRSSFLVSHWAADCSTWV